MGVRHAVLLIARIIPLNETSPKYRCIGSITISIIWKETLLEAMKRFIILTKHKDNAEIIREEINILNGVYPRWSKGSHYTITEFPCPYTHFLLSSAFNTDPEAKKFVAPICHESAATTWKIGFNAEEGVIFFDVTNPEAPAYGIVCDMNEIILTARDYLRECLREYHDRPEDPEESFKQFNDPHIKELLSEFADTSLITLNMLDEAWPGELYNPPTLDTAQITHTESDINPPDGELALPSLVDITTKASLETLSKSNLMDKLEVLFDVGKDDTLVKYIYGLNPVPDSALSLLSRIITGNTGILDLSRLALPPDLVRELISQWQDSDIHTVKLSHNPLVTKETLIHVLTIFPNLRRLFLLGKTISTRDLCDLMTDSPKLFFRLQAFVYPAFLKYSASRFRCSFTHYTISHDHLMRNNCTLPYFTPAQVIQGLSDHLEDYGIGVQAAYASEIRESETLLNDRFVPLHPPRSLQSYHHMQGWNFILFRHDNDKVQASYAFFRMDEAYARSTNSPEIDKIIQIYDYKGFLNACEDEGRPTPPTRLLDRFMSICENFDWCLLSASKIHKIFLELNRDRPDRF